MFISKSRDVTTGIPDGEEGRERERETKREGVVFPFRRGETNSSVNVRVSFNGGSLFINYFNDEEEEEDYMHVGGIR